MGEAYEDFRAAGADIVAVFQYRADPTFHFCRKRDVPFDCLGDPERDGLSRRRARARRARASTSAPSSQRASCARRDTARLPGRPVGDVAQRPGTFVVSPEGKVLYAHYQKDSSDNAPIGELLAAVRGA